jgi:hypothetical protein
MQAVYNYITEALTRLRIQERTESPLSEYQKGKVDVLRLIFHMLKLQYKNNRPL